LFILKLKTETNSYLAICKMGCDWWGEPYPRVSWYSTHATVVVETLWVISG